MDHTKRITLQTIITHCILYSIVLICSFNMVAIVAFAQSSTNAILLSFPKVTKDGQTVLTQSTGPNAWQFDGELSLDDAIRYGWNAVSLDIACKDKPQTACGYLKVYLNDDSKEENLITETGFSPLPIDRLAPRLSNGPNKLLFVYIDSKNPSDRSTKVSFTFNFKNTTTKPQITVVEPTESALFGRGITQNFRIELTNFALEVTDSGLPNRGKLNIYHSAVDSSKLLGTLSSSSEVSTGKQVVTFTSDDISMETIPDSLSTKLIFVLTNSKGEAINTNAELPVRTNYTGTLDVGLPKVTITEPRKDRTSLNVDTNQKFILQIDNFEILPEFNPSTPETGKGYLQILVDDAPIKTVWPTNSFSFADLGIADMTEGRKTIKVQLVNKDLSKLIPETYDTIDVVYTPSSTATTQDQTTQVQSNIWRIVMVILIVVLVIGGIAVLITKG